MDIELEKPIVVIVDDTIMVLQMYQNIVKATTSTSRVDVVACENGAQAIEELGRLKFEGRQPCLLLTDLEMGSGPNGFAVAALGRDLFPDMLIMIASGDHATLEDAIQEESGKNKYRYGFKPIGTGLLKALVRESVESWRRNAPSRMSVIPQRTLLL